MAKAWLIEDVNYDPVTWGIADSAEAAVAHLKEEVFAPPYVVAWEDPERSATEWTLRGQFSAVPGRSTEHKAVFAIRRYDLIASPSTQP